VVRGAWHKLSAAYPKFDVD